MTGLTRIDLSHTGFGDTGITIFAQHSADCTLLTQLSLEGNGISDQGAENLARTAVLISLRQLDLAHNDIGTEGATHLRLLPLDCQVTGLLHSLE